MAQAAGGARRGGGEDGPGGGVGAERRAGGPALAGPRDLLDLLLSAKDGEFDQADAFDIGADDYLTKPFSFVVLVARLRALVRRGAPARPVVMSAGSLSLDPARRRVTRGQTVLTLTPREYGVLEFLLRNKGMVLTKSQILRAVWDSNYDGDDNVVEVYIGYLRRKIDVPFGIASIETVRGVGYRLLADGES